MEYPKALTKANWLQNKGTLTSIADHLKIVDKSSIGAKLQELENAHNKIDWDSLTPRVGNTANFKILDPQHEQAVAVLNQIKGLVPLANTAKEQALRYQKEWASKKIAEKGAKLLGTIAAGCTEYVRDLGELPRQVEVDFQEAHQLIAQNLARYARTLLTTVQGPLKRAVEFVKKVEAAETAKAFNAGISGAARDITQNLTNVVKAIDKAGVVFKDPNTLRAITKVMEPWAQGSRMIPTDEPEEEKEMVGREVDAFRQVVEGAIKWVDANK